MARSVEARQKDMHARLLDVDKRALGRAVKYLSRDGWSAETAGDFLAQALLPTQSVHFRKGLSGDFNAAIRCVNIVFPGCEWTIDQDGADMNVNGKEYGYIDSQQSAALIRCILDAIMEYE